MLISLYLPPLLFGTKESQLQEDDTEKLVSIPKDQPSQGASSDEGDEQEDALEIDEEKFQAQLIDYDEFSDDFARMTLYLHGDSGKKVRYLPHPLLYQHLKGEVAFFYKHKS